MFFGLQGILSTSLSSHAVVIFPFNADRNAEALQRQWKSVVAHPVFEMSEEAAFSCYDIRLLVLLELE